MAKLPRVFQKIFGSTAGTNKISQFGSLAAGAPEFTTDPTTIQALSNFLSGWYSAVVGQNSPPIQDMNALFYLITYQLAQMFQDGVPEWDASTIYFVGSMVNDGAGNVYVCIDDSTGTGISNEPLTNPTYWGLYNPSAANSVLNSAFDFWSRGTTIAAAWNGTPTFVYGPDRWATINNFGSSAIITMSQTTGALSGSKYGMQVVMTSGGISVPAGIWHVLDNVDSLKFYNGNAYLTTNIKATGNVTAVEAQIFYATSLTNVAQNLVYLGSPVSITVNSSGFVELKMSQAVGTAMTKAGVVGFALEVSAVSTGHVYDNGNGFILEQSCFNPFGYQSSFQRAYACSETERLAIAAYFETNFNDGTAPATAVGPSGACPIVWNAITGSIGGFGQAYFKTRKRSHTSPYPVINLFNPQNASGSPIFNATASTNIAGAVSFEGQNGFAVATSGSFSAGDELLTNWTADAEIY